MSMYMPCKACGNYHCALLHLRLCEALNVALHLRQTAITRLCCCFHRQSSPQALARGVTLPSPRTRTPYCSTETLHNTHICTSCRATRLLQGIGAGGLCCSIMSYFLAVNAGSNRRTRPIILELLCHSHIFWCKPSKILKAAKLRFTPGLGFGLAPGLCRRDPGKPPSCTPC